MTFRFKPILTVIFFFIINFTVKGQMALPSMPEAVSNNAVAGYSTDALEHFVYSFAGIGTGLKYDDIHKKCFKYDFFAEEWSILPELPSGPGRIAAGATVVKDKIYIIGGYQVLSNGVEISQSKVHIFNPAADTFMHDAADIPVPIDDHIQVVWRDSLIYVVTGWSQNKNVTNVQIYNPAEDKWMMGSPVPSSGAYRVFGGSGSIVGDTIYYAGGARSGTNFPPSPYLRKGVINPANPTEITWTSEEVDKALGYRMAAESSYGRPIWFGGSKTTYNYDGIAYNRSGVVSPENDIKVYTPSDKSWYTYKDLMPKTMDFRGIVKFTENSFIIAGGMKDDQVVTDETWIIIIPTLADDDIGKKQFFPQLSPSPFEDELKIKLNGKWLVTMIDFSGKIIFSQNHEDVSKWKNLQISSGAYFLRFDDGENSFVRKVIKK